MNANTGDPLPVVDAFGRSDLEPLFDLDGPNHPGLTSVFLGNAPGRAVLDDAAAPSRALLCSGFGFTFLSRGANQAFLDRAVAQLRKEGPVVLIWPERDDQTLAAPCAALSVVPRYEYRARNNPAAALPPIPDGFALRRIDSDLLERCLWKGEVSRACGSAERFLEVGTGWCVVRGEEIASEAYAVLRGKGVFEIGAITARAHRGSGLAVHACQRLIEACEAEGMGTYWSCHQDNSASNRVATKLGYCDRRPYRFFVY